MDKKAYIDSEGRLCPFCSAEPVEGGFINIEAGKAFQDMHCAECASCWQDVYQLVDAIPEEKGERGNAATEMIGDLVDSALISGTVEVEYIDIQEDLAGLDTGENPIYIIGNPDHRLGFMVASPDDPLGYSGPVDALSDLGQMRQDHGAHLKLFQVMPADGPLVSKDCLETHIKDCGIEDFDYSLIKEYLTKSLD